jgi:diaminohydroxyphosphoribosylaminopyrimidine deaminase/5-amino-6-(5-phosphoribosylamino)uracil reductase
MKERLVVPVDADARFLRTALDLARRIPRRPWPNPPVGAVVVRDGEVVGRGAHHGAGEPHAERVAIQEAGARARGATLYCTLEPCNHTGRTPPCTRAILESGIGRVVVAVGDPNPTVAGGGLEVLRDAGVEVEIDPRLADACLDLIWPFTCTDNFARPYVELKTATTLDGRFTPARRPGRTDPGPVYVTGREALRDVHRRRRWVDLVLVGEQTARLDHPRLDGRLADAGDPCPAADPEAGYLDTDLSHDRGLNRDSFLVFCGEGALALGAGDAPPGAELVGCAVSEGRVDPADLLARAAARGIHAVMVEGGPELAASFLAAGLVDRWVHYTAPFVAGGGATWPADFSARLGPDTGIFHLTRVRRCGPDLCAVHDRRDFRAVLAAVTEERAARAGLRIVAGTAGEAGHAAAHRAPPGEER